MSYDDDRMMADTAAIAARAKPDAAPSPALTRELRTVMEVLPELRAAVKALPLATGPFVYPTDELVAFRDAVLAILTPPPAPTDYAGVRTKERTNAEDRRTIKEAVAKRREAPTSTREDR